MTPSPHSYAIISLLKGIVYTNHTKAWNNLLQYEQDIKEYFRKAGLEVYIDVPEGFAYLKQAEWEEEADLPTLADPRQLTFNVSLLIIQLRKYLLQQDMKGGTTRAIITKTEIRELMLPFMRSSNNEAKLEDEIRATINKVMNEYGFLRELKGDEESLELNRVIKGFVGADQIEQALRKLRELIKEEGEETV
jgi:Domain of unknown function (DUF4194)